MDYNRHYGQAQRLDQGRRTLHHQVSDISELSVETDRVHDGRPSGQHVQGRHSLVSLPSMASLQSSRDSHANQPLPPLPTWSSAPQTQAHIESRGQDVPETTYSRSYQPDDAQLYNLWSVGRLYTDGFRSGSGSYQPVYGSNPSTSSSQLHGQYHGRTRLQSRQPEAIYEEDKDETDITATAGYRNTTNTAAAPPRVQHTKVDSEMVPFVPHERIEVGLTSAATEVGSWLAYQQQMPDYSSAVPQQRLQEPHERLGDASGAAAFQPEATIREADLLEAASPKSAGQRPLSFTRRFSTKIKRNSTAKLAQDEADRRNEIIEVIMEKAPEPISGASGFDLSEFGRPPFSMDSASSPLEPAMGRSMFPNREQTVQVFFPQPDWKPVVMRWPYLAILILLSLTLGIETEVLCRRAAEHPLATFNTREGMPYGVLFAYKFAPTLIAVSYGVLWQMTDVAVRRLEPFYQLSRPEGALAQESLNVDYITLSSILWAFQALRHRHYAVFFSSVAALLAGAVVPTLGAASIVLVQKSGSDHQDPQSVVVMDLAWARVLISVLFVIAALGCVLLWQLKRRRSGLFSDVKGIAGLASMAVVSHIFMDFKDMDVASHQAIHRQLKNRRYALRNSSLTPIDSLPTSKPGPPAGKRVQGGDTDDSASLPDNPHSLMLRATACVPLITGVLLFLVLVYLVLFTRASAVADNAPWLMTLLAVCIKMAWGGLDIGLRVMEPYHILWRRHAPASVLSLDYTAMPIGWVAVKALANGHVLVFLVGFGAVISEVLTVLVTWLTASGQSILVDVNGKDTRGAVWAGLGLVTFMLVYMALVATAVVIKRGRPFLPRQPNTIASVLGFIHQSNMVRSFVGTSKLDSGAMKKRLGKLGKTYGVGWFEGRDGLQHCGVDEEELLGSFVPGYDYGKATRPWRATASQPHRR